MMDLIAVGGTLGPIGSGGWDAWPLVGIVIALWISRRVLDIPWGAPIIVVALVSALVFPPVVHARGVVPTLALTAVAAVIARHVRAQRKAAPPNTV